MSQQQYHWEALRKQRVIDRKHAYFKSLQEKQAQLDECNTETMAREELESRQAEHQRRLELAEEVKQRDRRGIRNSYKEREERIQKLVSERQWHDDLIAKMNQQEKDEMLRDLLRDHKQKSKVLRDRGLVRGDFKFFCDPDYN